MPESVKSNKKSWPSSIKWIVAAAIIIIVPASGIAIGYLQGPVKTSGRVIKVVIPRGAEQQIKRGKDVVPTSIVGRVDDRLVIINNDKYSHQLGMFFLQAGQKLEYPLIRAGNYSALCALTSTKRFQLIVLPQVQQQ